jgi:hypothetical protein
MYIFLPGSTLLDRKAKKIFLSQTVHLCFEGFTIVLNFLFFYFYFYLKNTVQSKILLKVMTEGDKQMIKVSNV